MSHLDIGRLVFDAQQTGFAQLGTVWLPLGHILELPFVWNNTLWHTGLAGSLVSMGGYLAGGYAMFRLVRLIGGNYVAAVVATSVYAFNLNLLYLQTTPMTEPLYVGLLVMSIYYFVRYLRSDSIASLIVAGILSAFQVLDRYDGWFVASTMAASLLTYEMVVRRTEIRKAIGLVILFVAPTVFAMSIWLGWNLVLFGNPLYAFTGPNSAHSQQAYIASTRPLYDKGNLLSASKSYFELMGVNIGYLVLGVGALGWVVFLVFNRTFSTGTRCLILTVSVSVIVFNIIALFLGFSIVELPGLHPQLHGKSADSLFNVRYGVLALPFAALGCGLLSMTRRTVALGVIVAMLFQTIITFHSGIITLEDGTQGTSAALNQDVAAQLKRDVRPGQVVLMSFASYNPVAFRSGLPLSTFLQEGVNKTWLAATAYPSRFAQFIVISNGPSSDVLYGDMVGNHNYDFRSQFHLVFRGSNTSIYELDAASTKLGQAAGPSRPTASTPTLKTTPPTRTNATPEPTSSVRVPLLGRPIRPRILGDEAPTR